MSKTNPKGFAKNQIPLYLYLIPLAIFMAAPIVFIIFHAFKPMDELFLFPPRFLVYRPTLENFTALFRVSAASTVPVSRYVFNSALVTVSVVMLTVITASMAGFSLSKMKFRGKAALFTINNLALMFVPAAVTIPRYMTISNIGIDNTYLAHILPIVAAPVIVFLIKQFMDQVPDSLIEAATVDGAGAWRIYLGIMLPMTKPALATGAILSFQMVWNNIETSALFTTSESIRTLPFYMNTLAAAGGIAGQGMAAAAALIMFVPNLLLFIFMQGRVMNTMAHSGLK
ncbi:MAG: carbohydrate ABC transporter permease [Defluviitaleaceae bacterium]|nr:carbohydrate ABC transporter permease [Defluviitaleaceae bacterium]MCL2238926.1 carbohydrate ABC transporter permease [Defluviitaleaceae bacterium]